MKTNLSIRTLSLCAAILLILASCSKSTTDILKAPDPEPEPVVKTDTIQYKILNAKNQITKIMVNDSTEQFVEADKSTQTLTEWKTAIRTKKNPYNARIEVTFTNPGADILVCTLVISVNGVTKSQTQGIVPGRVPLYMGGLDYTMQY